MEVSSLFSPILLNAMTDEITNKVRRRKKWLHMNTTFAGQALIWGEN
jgi:hypothetical protein